MNARALPPLEVGIRPPVQPAAAVDAPPLDIRPGDIITMAYGMRREIDLVTVHDVHTYPSGDVSIRYSYTSNPAGVDWRGFIDREDPDVHLVSRGVAAVRTSIHSLLP